MLRIKNIQDTNKLYKRLIHTNSSTRDEKVRQGRLIIQDPQDNQTLINNIPLKTVNVKNNLINNRLLITPKQTLQVDPMNKKKRMIQSPAIFVENENAKYRKNEDPNFAAYVADYYKRLDENSIKRNPYWAPLWIQYNYPYIYDLPVLVPISNNFLDKISSYEKRKKLSEFNQNSYFPIIVKKKNKNKNLAENFRLPQTYRYQNRIHHINHRGGSSRGLHNRYINNSTRLYDPYLYYPLSSIYTYDERALLPFDINDALIPIYDLNKIKETFNEIPKGYKLITLRIIEINDEPIINYNLIIVIILIIIIYWYYKKNKKSLLY